MQNYCFLMFLNKIYNTYCVLHMCSILNNALKITLDIATYTNCRECFLLHSLTISSNSLSHVMVADPDSSDSNRLYPNERYGSI